jgi:pilus assembly protein CpaC
MYSDFVKGLAPPGDGPDKQAFSDFLNLFFFNNKYNIGTVIKALQTKGLFQSLAEPNLVAESGKEASFLAGGEIPVPVVQGGGNFTAVTVVWKEFGIRLNFTPTVLGGGLVQLKVRPEVSTLDFNNAIVLQGFRIPALSTRRTETEIQLQNGQTFAIAGLLNRQVASTLNKMPGIGDIPILGLLFKSKAAQKEQTELVVMITPQILDSNSPGVTQALPRAPEPFLPPLPPNKSFEPPPPAFQSPQKPSADATSPVPLSPVASPSPAPLSPAAAAAAVSALTPKGPTPVVPANSPTQPGAAGRPALATPAQQGSTTGAATTTSPTTDAGRPLTAQEQKTLERARREEQQKLEADRKAKAEEAKRAAKQAEVDARRMAKEQERQEKLARDQATRDAEAAKKAQAAAKTAAEAAKR